MKIKNIAIIFLSCTLILPTLSMDDTQSSQTNKNQYIKYGSISVGALALTGLGCYLYNKFSNTKPAEKTNSDISDDLNSDTSDNEQLYDSDISDDKDLTDSNSDTSDDEDLTDDNNKELIKYLTDVNNVNNINTKNDSDSDSDNEYDLDHALELECQNMRQEEEITIPDINLENFNYLELIKIFLESLHEYQLSNDNIKGILENIFEPENHHNFLDSLSLEQADKFAKFSEDFKLYLRNNIKNIEQYKKVITESLDISCKELCSKLQTIESDQSNNYDADTIDKNFAIRDLHLVKKMIDEITGNTLDDIANNNQSEEFNNLLQQFIKSLDIIQKRVCLENDYINAMLKEGNLKILDDEYFMHILDDNQRNLLNQIITKYSH